LPDSTATIAASYTTRWDTIGVFDTSISYGHCKVRIQTPAFPSLILVNEERDRSPLGEPSDILRIAQTLRVFHGVKFAPIKQSGNFGRDLIGGDHQCGIEVDVTLCHAPWSMSE
jgi:hypothetical protein